MARPKKKVIGHGKEEKGPQAQGDVLTQSAPVPEEKPAPRRHEEKPDAPEAIRIAESRKALEHPLPAGQKFFESPEGEIFIGEADKNEMWSRHMNGGRGGWINPRR